MARRSQRLSTGGIPTAKHKRAASGSAITITAAKKPKKQQVTPKKSQYFEDPGSDEHQSGGADDDESAFSEETTASEFGNDEAESVMSEPADSEEEENSDDATSRKKTASGKSGEVWRPGVKAGLGPGKQVIIKKPKARPAGDTPYSEETIHPNTLLFLEELKANNDREWLKMHDAVYRQSERDWHTFVSKTTEKLTEIDDTIPELPVKDVIFRIYRDVRFSKDKTAYKPWFSVAWSRDGRKGSYAHYYVQVAPNKSFVGGGIWAPDARSLARMRRAIDRNPRMLKDILMNEEARKEFLDGAGKSHAAVAKAFVKSNSSSALKTKPKGYEADHPDIDILRLRTYTIGKSLSDEEVLGEVGVNRITDLLACLKPFITYLNTVVMPDDESQSEGASEGDEEQSDAGEHA